MKISTIMVCRNASATISGAVESFLAQDHTDKELVLVDGASTDDTVARVQAFDAPEISVTSEPDAGIYDAMNKGLRRFTGDAFGFLNADDRYHDARSLSRIAEALEAHEMVSGHLNFVSEHGAAPLRIWRASTHVPGAFHKGWAPAHPVTYARRSVLDRTGPFDAGFRSAGDYDWMMRALELDGADHGVIDAVLVDMAMGGVSTAGWRARLTNARELLQARRKRLGTGPLDAALFLGPLRKLSQLRMRLPQGAGQH